MNQLLELLNLPTPPKCKSCDGSGLAPIACQESLDRVCWCSTCNGTGIHPMDTKAEE